MKNCAAYMKWRLSQICPWRYRKLYLSMEGFADLDGKRSVLVCVEHADCGHLFDMYFPGGIIERKKGALAMHGGEARGIYRRCGNMRDELFAWAERKAAAPPARMAADMKTGCNVVPFYEFDYERTEEEERMAESVKIADDIKIEEAGEEKSEREAWYELYSDAQLGASHSAVHHDPDGDHVYVRTDCIYDREIGDEISFVLRLPEGEISYAAIASSEERPFPKEALKTVEVAERIQRIMDDKDVIMELAKRVDDPECTDREMNDLRDKIGGKIYRSMPVECPYCGESLLGEKIRYTVNIPVSFWMHSGNFGIHEEDAYQAVTEAVQAGKATGECLHCTVS